MFAEHSDDSSEAVIKGATVRADHMLATRSESLRKFATESPVGGLVGSVLGVAVRFYMDQMFFRRSGPMAHTLWHQDTSYHNVTELTGSCRPRVVLICAGFGQLHNHLQ